MPPRRSSSRRVPTTATHTTATTPADTDDADVWETSVFSSSGETVAVSPAEAAESATPGPEETYAWIAGDSDTVKAIRRILVGEVGMARHQVAFMGYWKVGTAQLSAGLGPSPAAYGTMAGARSADERSFMEIWPGQAYPLGATYDGTGVNFAVFSEVADRIELCLIDGERDDLTETRIAFPRSTVSSGTGPRPVRPAGTALRLPGPRSLRPGAWPSVQPGQTAPRPLRQGDRGAGGKQSQALFSYTFGDPDAASTTRINTEDSLGHTMLSVVTNPFFYWANDRPPRHEYHDTVIYEAHVEGLTRLHPEIPEGIRARTPASPTPPPLRTSRASG